jgi:uncharacterized membrane protein
MTQSIMSALTGFPNWAAILIISMIPVVELRGAIPWGDLVLKMPYWQTFLLALVGNCIPAPLILKFMPALLEWMRGTKVFGPFANWLHARGMKKTKNIEQYKFWGLTIFIAIPLPGTGVWTGCLAASLMEMDFKQGMLCAFLGAAIAGVVVSAICALGMAAAAGLA